MACQCISSMPQASMHKMQATRRLLAVMEVYVTYNIARNGVLYHRSGLQASHLVVHITHTHTCDAFLAHHQWENSTA